MRLALLVSLLFAAACAGPQVAPTADPPRAPAPRRAAAATDEEDLNHAFQPDPVEAPPTAARPAPAAPSEQENAEASARALERKVRDAVNGKRLEEARAALAELSPVADAAGGPARVAALELAFRVENVAAVPDAAEAAGWRWLTGCGPEQTEGCRASARAALQGLKGLPPPQQKKLATQLLDLAQAEQCPAKVERLGHPDGCLFAAERAAAHRQDEWLEMRLALAKARTEKAAPRKQAALERVADRCKKPQCAQLRHQTFRQLAALAEDAEAQARFGLLAMHALADALPAEKRLYARTDDVERPCARYEEKAGAGACRKLEKQLTGHYAFKDFSRTSVGRALPADRVRTVNEHYQPLLQECLEAQARRMRPPDIVRYELKWTVLNDGRVGEAHLRQDLDDSELARCVRAQFSAWRYPRYDGELEHVEQSFTISAVERRP